MDKLVTMQSFVRVVETGSFSVVARELNTNQATISKRVAALESDLGSQLLVRGSRKHRLTEVGQGYYERVLKILAQLNDAESEARSSQMSPQGKLRVTAPTMFGGLYVAAEIPKFLAKYPEIELDIKYSERMLNLVEEGLDVAIRLGKLDDSSMIARNLGYDDLILVTSPNYLTNNTKLTSIDELKDHNCLIYSLSNSPTLWRLSDNKKTFDVKVKGNFQCDSGWGLIEMLLADAGIALMPYWLVSDYIKAKQLVHILPEYKTRYPISAIYPSGRYLTLKAKCFIDFIHESLKADKRIINL